jgi:hypothetical protein
MPPENKKNIESLEYILENSLHPEVLDSHPWTKSLVVGEYLAETPELKSRTPGQQLIITIAAYFTRMRPPTPPLGDNQPDESWGEFGILAAQYFAPLLFGTPIPVSLREAWMQIDQSILLFVFETSDVPQAQKDLYKLIGDGPGGITDSALDDWYRQGLQNLAETLAARELFLSESNGIPAVIAQTTPKRHKQKPPITKPKKRAKISRAVWMTFLSIFLVLIGLIGYGALKAQKINQKARVVQEDVKYFQKLLAEPNVRLGKFKNIGSAVSTLRRDFAALKSETQPFFWMGPMLGWVPERGPDLIYAKDLATLAESLLAAADLSYQAVAPLVNDSELSKVNPAELTAFLKKNQPQLSQAQQSLKQAEQARARLKPEYLSPQMRDLILNNVDPAMRIIKDGLTVATELPLVMGAGNKGPQIYLLLVQNEDELRPTGGFITAASTVIIQNGDVGDLNFVNSGDLDNWYKIYPAAPWQLKEYMNSPVLVFRDANWYTNYPTTAAYAKYLYSFANDRSVNGVIAFDQRLLIEMLQATGPIKVEGAPRPISADNIIQYMRESKTPNAQEAASSNWDNKAFLNDITHALLQKMLNGEVDWEMVSTILLRALNQHHLLLQVDNPGITEMLARHHWDGSVNPGTGDFLMAVDTNVGFNKTNAMVESSLAYDVDLTDPSNPTGSLVVTHKNNVQKSLVCKQWLKNNAAGEENYPITDCYWNYLRVYKSAGTALISATPQVVPDMWMINKQKKPGQVDILQEDIPGVQAFGTLEVIPAGESLAVNFEFALPAHVLQINDRRMTYTLRTQKQPGTLAVPLTVRIHLPKGASVETMPPKAVVENNNILYETNLGTDFELLVIFSTP